MKQKHEHKLTSAQENERKWFTSLAQNLTKPFSISSHHPRLYIFFMTNPEGFLDTQIEYRL